LLRLPAQDLDVLCHNEDSSSHFFTYNFLFISSLMACAKFSSQTYSSHLSQKEAEAESLRREAEQEQDNEKAQQSEDILEMVSQTRAAAKKANVPLGQIYVLKGGNETKGQTMGMYERKVGTQGRTGMTDMENFQNTTEGKDITRQVENTLLHEWKGHRAAHGRSIAKGNDGILQSSLGEEAAEAIDEENAMRQERGGNAESGKPAEYAGYRKKTRQISSELRTDVAKLLAQGDEDKIAEKAQEKEGNIIQFPQAGAMTKAA
jgi:hypothetical protein